MMSCDSPNAGSHDDEGARKSKHPTLWTSLSPLHLFAAEMLGLSGLAGRESGGERLVGKDYAVAVGLRVVFSKRYEGDAWARDESAGRAGTVVELLEPYTHEGRVQHAACRVRWDRADSRQWQHNTTSDSLSTNYTGYYRCGSKGCHHLAVSPGEGLPALPAASEKELKMAKERLLDLKQFNAPLDELPPATAPPAWGAPEIDLDSLTVAPDMLAARRQEIESELGELEERLAAQIQGLSHMAQQCLDEAESALGAVNGEDEAQGDQEEDAKEKEKKEEVLSAEEETIKKQQELLTADMERLWKSVEKAQKAYQKKVEADEEARKAADALEDEALGRYLVQVVAGVPEIIYRLDRIAKSGEDRRFTSPATWAAATRFLGGDEGKGDAPAPSKGVEDARKRIKEVIDELWPLLMPNNEEAMRPELVVRIIEDGMDAIYDKLGEAAGEKEAEQVKEEIEGMVARLKQGDAALKKLKESDVIVQNPLIRSLKEISDARKAREEARSQAIEEMKEIAKDGKDGDKKKDEKKDDKDKKKDDKKDDKDKKEEEKPATGPEWDPLDVLGAASLGDEVEDRMAMAREALGKMLTRNFILSKEREELAKKRIPSGKVDSGSQTESRVLRLTRRLMEDRGAQKGKKADRGMDAFLKANPSLNLLPGDESEHTVYNTLGARLTVFDPVPLDMPKDVGATDLVKARRALRDATQALLMIDASRLEEELEGAGGKSVVPLQDETDALVRRAQQLDHLASRVEQIKMKGGAQATAVGQFRGMGTLRGELVGDVGDAASSYADARANIEEGIEAASLAEESRRHSQIYLARWNMRRAVDQAMRLLAEGQGLKLEAEKKAEEGMPLDACILLKDSRLKVARAAALPSTAADQGQNPQE